MWSMAIPIFASVVQGLLKNGKDCSRGMSVVEATITDVSQGEPTFVISCTGIIARNSNSKLSSHPQCHFYGNGSSACCWPLEP